MTNVTLYPSVEKCAIENVVVKVNDRRCYRRISSLLPMHLIIHQNNRGQILALNN
jgi:hypothetical protein